MSERSEIKTETLIYLNALIGSDFLITCIDAMEGTKVFRQSMKNRAKAFRRELENQNDTVLSQIWGIKDESLYAIMQEQQELLEYLSVNSPELCKVFLKVAERLKEDPEDVIEYLGMEDEFKEPI